MAVEVTETERAQSRAEALEKAELTLVGKIWQTATGDGIIGDMVATATLSDSAFERFLATLTEPETKEINS